MVVQHTQALRDTPGCATPASGRPMPARKPRIRRRTGSPRQSNAGMNRLSHCHLKSVKP